jgi:two-component system phosphate regulon sensor histidine kinase PhoR
MAQSPSKRWQRMRTLMSHLITPRERQASALDLLQAQAFFAVCWLIVGLGLAIRGVANALEGEFASLVIYLLIGTVALAALRGWWGVRRWMVVLVGVASGVLHGMTSSSPDAAQFALLLLSNMMLLGMFALSIQQLIALGAIVLIALGLIVSVYGGALLEGISLSVVGTTMGALVIRLVWGPLVYTYFNALYAGLVETMQTMQQHTTGFLYRLAVADKNHFTLTLVFGSPDTTVGKTSEQLMAAGGWHAQIHPDDRHLLRFHWMQAVAKGEHSVEYRVRGSESQGWLWMHDHASAQSTARGLVVHGVLRNITEKKNAEVDLRTYVLQQAIIAELGMRAIQFESLGQLAEHAALCVEQVMDISGCEVYEYLPATDQMELRGAAGAYTRPERRLSLSDQSLPLREALRQDYLLLNYIPESPPYNEHAFFVRHRIQHSLMITISSPSGPYGLLTVYRANDRPFIISEVYFLQSICNIIGTFIETQHSRQQQRRHVEMTLALREAVTLIVTEMDLPAVLDRILDTLRTLIPAHDASTLMLADDSDVLRVVAQRGYDDILGYLAEVQFNPKQSSKYSRLVSNRYIVIQDTQQDPDWEHRPETSWIRSYLGAPILIDGQFIGLINLDSQRVSAFTDADGIVLSVLAEKASLAIRNARRTAELEALVQARTGDLQAERKRLQTILEATGDGIVYVEDGLMRYANRALSQLTGFSLSDLLDQPVAAFITGVPSHIESKRAERCDGMLRCKNGDVLPVELTLSTLRAQDACMVIVVRDVSARRALETQQRRFVINAAHELRTPVTNFNTRLYLLEKQPGRVDDHLPVLKRIAERMNRLVNDLLDSGSIEQGRLVIRKEPMVLQTVLQETLALLQAEADAKQISTTLTLLPEPTTLNADAHRLQQVFTNLITNAIYYTPSGGSVTVSQRLEGDYVVVDVSDTGIGIAPEHHQAIFEPFYRVETRHVGTGLGLAISQEIIRLHDGRIRLESALGRGSTFSVLLPCEQAQDGTTV